MRPALSFPGYIWREDEVRPALEVSIDFLPKQFEGRWIDAVTEFTAGWVLRSRFAKKATLWNWCCISVNLISRHPQNQVPSLSEFIVQFGFPEDFLNDLEEALCKPFDNQLGMTEMLLTRRADGWRPICHVEAKRAWKTADSPDDWVPVEAPHDSKIPKSGRNRTHRA